jgi:hypothetical protein
MIKEFVETFATLIAEQPEQVNVELHHVDEWFSEVVIYSSREDVGKLIGKEGKMIKAIKTLISGCKAKDKHTYRILVKPVDER